MAAAFVPFVQHERDRLDYDRQLIEEEAALYGQLPEAIAKAGGREHILACGSVYAGPFDVQAMAWFLHLHGEQIEIFPFPPGSLITGPTPLAGGRSALPRDRPHTAMGDPFDMPHPPRNLKPWPPMPRDPRGS